MRPTKKAFAVVLILFTIINTNTRLCAQDLPNKQENSLYAPANVKTDGNADEWDNKFQAYNHAIDCYYTIANNGENLYIVIQSKDREASGKITAGGITVKFDDPGKNNDRVASFTYGAVPASARVRISGIRGAAARDGNEPNVADINNELAYARKEIDVKNLDSIPDGSIAIYNEYHIAVAGHYNDPVVYTYELCIPIKYIRSYFNNASAVNYTIQINGQDINGNDNAVRINGVMQETLTPEAKALLNSILASPEGASLRYLNSPTNFPGTYTLAKKP